MKKNGSKKKFKIKEKLNNAEREVTDKMKDIIHSDHNEHVNRYEWNPKTFSFRPIFHYGIPANPTVMAFEPVQRVVAIGNSKGLVKVIGKPNVELVINNYSGGPITGLNFLPNGGLLLISHSGGSKLDVVNIKRKKNMGKISLSHNDRVTRINHAVGSGYFIIGTLQGNVKVINVEKAQMCTYSVSCRVDLCLKKSQGVSVLQINPKNGNVLLVGHYCGTLLEWDISNRKIIKRYTYGNSVFPPKQYGKLNTATYNPEGTKILAGYESGDLLRWNGDNEKQPQKKYEISRALAKKESSTNLLDEEKKRRPIKRIRWATLADKSFVSVLGGTSVDDESNGIVVRYRKKLSLLETPRKNGEILDFCVVSNSRKATPGIINPISILGLTTDSTFCSFEIKENGKCVPIPSPPSLLLQNSPVTCSKIYEINDDFIKHLKRTGKIVWSCNAWPLVGGSQAYLEESPNSGSSSSIVKYSKLLLITGHTNGILFFWDVSTIDLKLLYVISVKEFAKVKKKSIEHIELCTDSRVLTVCCKSGEVLVYKFSNDAKRVKSKQKKDSKNNTTNKSSSSSSSSSSSNNNNNDNDGEGFSWKQFLLDPKIDEKSGTKCANNFDSNKITEDLIDMFDNDMMDMAGVTSVGDRMRILKYAKEYKTISKKQQSSSSNNNNNHNESSKNKKSKSTTATTIIPAGYQIQIQCTFPKAVVNTCICSKQKKLAMGDEEGNVAIFDLKSGNCLLYKSLGKVVNAKRAEGNQEDYEEISVKYLMFDEQAKVLHKVKRKKGDREGLQKKKKKKLCIENGLYVGLENGSLFFINLKTGKTSLLPLSHYKSTDEYSILLKASVIYREGSELKASTVDWHTEIQNELEKKNKKKKSSQNLMKEEEEEFLPVDLDQKRKNDEKNNNMNMNEIPEKFMFVCIDNNLIIYSIPTYKVYASYSIPEVKPIAVYILNQSCDNQYCLAVFTSGGDLHLFSLLSLEPILTIPNAFHNFGIEFRPNQLEDFLNVTIDGRFLCFSHSFDCLRISLFSYENSLQLPQSFPSIFQSQTSIPESELSNIHQFFSSHCNYKRLFQETMSEVEQKKKSRAEAYAIEVEEKEKRKAAMAKQHPTAGSAGSSNNKTAEIRNLMAENLRSLQERGEKLQAMEESSNRMVHYAEEYAAAMQQANRKQRSQPSSSSSSSGSGSRKKKSWW